MDVGNMKTVLIAKQKGGVGATTCARELAVAAAGAGLTVAIADLDPQRTLTRWWSRRQTAAPLADGAQPNPALLGVPVAEVPSALAQLATGGVDLAILDTPPGMHPLVLGLARHADLALCPTRPTTDDLEALATLLPALGGAPMAFVVTQAPSRSRLYDEAVRLLAQQGRVAPPIRYRQDYPAAAAEGRAACESASSKAAEEIADLWRWLMETGLALRPASQDAMTPGRKQWRRA